MEPTAHKEINCLFKIERYEEKNRNKVLKQI